MNTFLLILRTKKTKIRCKVVISMVFNENQELDYIFWNNEYSFLNIVIHFALRLGNFIFVIYTSVFCVYVAICLINGSHFYGRILKIQLKKSKIVGNLGRKYKSLSISLSSKLIGFNSVDKYGIYVSFNI